jgi:hypothetical protein
MESESSLPFSQQPVTCPYFEQDRPSPRSPLPLLLLEDSFRYYHPIYFLAFSEVSYFHIEPSQPRLQLFLPPIPATCCAHLFLILAPE